MLFLIHHQWLNHPAVEQTLNALRTVYETVTVLDCDQLSTNAVKQYFTEHGAKPVWFIAPNQPDSVTQRTVGTHLDWLQQFELKRHGTSVSRHVKTLDALPNAVNELMESICLLS